MNFKTPITTALSETRCWPILLILITMGPVMAFTLIGMLVPQLAFTGAGFMVVLYLAEFALWIMWEGENITEKPSIDIESEVENARNNN